MGQKAITKNTLFYGDNLDIMRDYLADESVDLIYLDPPFNSSRNYNVLYKDESGVESSAQIVAFEDTWHWTTQTTEPEFNALKERGDKLGELLTALVSVMGRNAMTAYLVMMASRLVELRRVLKPTGSLYLHCDPTASHYLKLILDLVFGVANFRNEIVWERTSGTGSSKNLAKKFPANTDTILFYTKTDNYTFSHIIRELSETALKRYDKIDEQGRRFFWADMRTYSNEKLERMLATGDAKFSPTAKNPRYKKYLDETKGTPTPNIWYDIEAITSTALERLGYPTQKPITLLERIIQASSNPGDVVLDPFCGCGTATHAAQKLKRTWIGIDITRLATTLIKSRLFDAFGIVAKKDYDLIGEPTTLDEAQHLATKDDRYQFQWWALGLIPARPQGGQGDSKAGKKGADKGIDGVMTFQDNYDSPHHRILVQVKSGKVKSGDIRDLNGTVDREKAVMGVFVTLEPPSRPMEIEALEIGHWHSHSWNQDYPKIQILTIEQLLNGTAKVKFPGMKDTTLSKAKGEDKDAAGEQRPLL